MSHHSRDNDPVLYLHPENGTLYPIEIKKSASHGKEALKHFCVLEPVTEPEKFNELSQTKVKIGIRGT